MNVSVFPSNWEKKVVPLKRALLLCMSDNRDSAATSRKYAEAPVGVMEYARVTKGFFGYITRAHGDCGQHTAELAKMTKVNTEVPDGSPAVFSCGTSEQRTVQRSTVVRNGGNVNVRGPTIEQDKNMKSIPCEQEKGWVDCRSTEGVDQETVYAGTECYDSEYSIMIIRQQSTARSRVGREVNDRDVLLNENIGSTSSLNRKMTKFLHTEETIVYSKHIGLGKIHFA